MSTRLVTAPATAGKTTACIDHIQELRGANPLVPIWVCLPNRWQVAAFRRRLADSGGAIGVSLGTFYTLYREILSRARQSVPELTDPVLHRVLRATADCLDDEGELSHYSSIVHNPGFLRGLRELVRELKQGQIQPDELRTALEDDPPRLRELARLYAAYQQWLVEEGWMDGEGLGWLAAVALEEDSVLCRDWELLVVDGFDQFNPTQLGVLSQLAERVGETWVTLTGAARDRMAHRRFRRARADLEAALEVEVEPLPRARRHLASPIAHLEAHLFEPDAGPHAPDDAVELLTVSDRASEPRAALRWLKARLMKDGLSPDEVVLLARDLGPYRPFLTEAAAEFGLPLKLADSPPLEANPAVSSLLELLSLPWRDWPRREVIEAWRCPYFSWSGLEVDREPLGIGPGDAERLAAVARWGQVMEGVEQWREALERLIDRLPFEEERGEPASVKVPCGQEAVRLLECWEGFVRRLTPPDKATMQEYVGWVEDLIGEDPELRTRWQKEEPDNQSARMVAQVRDEAVPEEMIQRDISALQAFKDVLRGLVVAEKVVGAGELVSFEQFWREVHGAVEAATYPAPIPAQEAILAANVHQARGLSFAAVALIGLAEGAFPLTSREDVLLSDSEREDLRGRGLALQPRLGSDEATTFYQAITRAKRKLLLTRPRLADDGASWQPSPYWEEIKKLTGMAEDKVPAVRSGKPLSLKEVASWPELALGLASADDDPASNAYLRWVSTEAAYEPRWAQVKTGAEILAARSAEGVAGPFDGDVSSLSSMLSRTFGPGYMWSASKLETYGSCPYRFYAAHALKLELREPPQEGPDPGQLGSIYHRILELVYRRVDDPTDIEALLQVLPRVAGEVLDQAPRKYGFRPTAWWDQRQREIKEEIEGSLQGLCESLEGYTPLRFEVAFGRLGVKDTPKPCLELLGPGGDDIIRLRGLIDRIDKDAAGDIRIIDYKTFGGRNTISYGDLEEGTRLQLPLYALAARQVLGLGAPVAGFYWHVKRAERSRFALEGNKTGVKEAIQQAVEHTRAHVAAVRGGEFTPTPPDQGCPSYCPATHFCWNYQPRY